MSTATCYIHWMLLIQAQNHTYAIKTFRGSRGQRVYKVEHEGHSAVASVGQPIESLVRMYSHFTYQDECSIVFEYVEGPTWREYMEKTEPPKRPNDVAKIWRSLLELAEAVDRFHTAKGYTCLRRSKIWWQLMLSSVVTKISAP